MKKLLRRISMRVPNSDDVYAPSKLDQMLHFKDTSRMNNTEKMVSLDEDGISNPIKKIAYALGLDGWYIE